MAALPFVLAGPFVRRVEERSCSFFVALSQAARVRAAIWEDSQTLQTSRGAQPKGSGESDALQIGKNLFVALVQIDLAQAGQALTPGKLYAYDIAFTGSVNTDLAQEGLLRNEKADNRLKGVDPGAPLH